MAKIYRVIQIKLNQLVLKCPYGHTRPTYQQSVFKRYHSTVTNISESFYVGGL